MKCLENRSKQLSSWSRERRGEAGPPQAGLPRDSLPPCCPPRLPPLCPVAIPNANLTFPESGFLLPVARDSQRWPTPSDDPLGVSAVSSGPTPGPTSAGLTTRPVKGLWGASHPGKETPVPCTKPGIGRVGAEGGMGGKGWTSALSHFTFSVA